MSGVEHVDGARMEGLPNDGFYSPSFIKQERPPSPPHANAGQQHVITTLRDVPSPDKTIDPFLSASILKFIDPAPTQMQPDWNLDTVDAASCEGMLAFIFEGTLCLVALYTKRRPGQGGVCVLRKVPVGIHQCDQQMKYAPCSCEGVRD